MANTLDLSIRGLNDCDGCEGNEASTPVKVWNRPGLSRFSYRVGTHGRFFQSMLARLSNADYPALRALNVRDPADLTIALLDACAAADDVLTFYTERYAQEWYVRSATERISLVQMARLIGYEPRPGVAATAYLAFTIENTPGSPESTTVDAGVRVMSIPGKDELPQTFETSAAIEARSTWNAMKARAKTPQVISIEMTQVLLEGVIGTVQKGDSLLIVQSETENVVKRVLKVTPSPAANTTTLDLADSPSPSNFSGGLPYISVQYTSVPALTDDSFSDVFQGAVYNSSDVIALQMTYHWSPADLYYAANTPPPPPPAESGVFALRQRAAIFGHTAPKWSTFPQFVEGQTAQMTGAALKNSSVPVSKWQYPDDWDDASVTDGPGVDTVIDLDSKYPSIVENSWVVLESPSQTATAFRVEKNQEMSRADFTLTAKVSRLSLYSNVPDDFKMRETTVLAASEQLPLAQAPLTDLVAGNSLVLDQYYPGLVEGRFIILSGTRADLNGAPASEVRKLASIEIDGTLEPGRLFTRLIFTEPLAYTYHRSSVTINANVAEATHGETKSEVMGGGDGVTRFQTFALKQKPLTYTSAATPTGAKASLEVRVDNVLWAEAPTLYGHAPDERVYTIRHEDDRTARVQFNAQIPSGTENVTAKYRIGIGLDGMLNTGQLSLLGIKPLGVRSVTNPVPPNGAEDRESLEDLRDNSPLTVLTLDRLVSLKDYEDFARAFAGFSKAQAVPAGEGAVQSVFLTVAGETGVVSETDAAFSNLAAAIKASGDPFVTVVIKPHREALFQVGATLGIDSAYLVSDVLSGVETALRTALSFDARSFGQPVTQLEVIALMQNVPGVVFVNLTALFRSDPLNPNQLPSLNARLSAAAAQISVAGAELLTLDPRPLALNLVTV